MKRLIVLTAGLIVCLMLSAISCADQIIVAKKVAAAAVIDGKADDAVWAQAAEYTTYDTVAKINVTLKAVYTDSQAFFLVGYPDADESSTHKSWVWDKSTEMYKTGPDREDVFVFKWSMEPNPVDLTLKSDNDYMSDVWFWKACRSNPAGYADDKYQRLSSTELPKSNKMISKSGKTMYLIRIGDSGTPASEEVLYVEYKGEKMPHYVSQVPTGSEADVKAKGVWSAGRWVIEFARSLKTGNEDDVQFDTSKSYLFGVSRYEIAGRDPDPELDQPLYGSGDISESLTLQFGQ